MAQVLVKKKEETKSDKKARVMKTRIPVTDPKCVNIREAIGQKWGAIGKDSFELSMMEELNNLSVYKDKLKFSLADVERFLKAFTNATSEAAKTAQAVLTSEGADIQTVTIWNPITSSKAKVVGSTTSRDMAILRELSDKKAELAAEGKTEDEINADAEVVAMKEAFDKSVTETDNGSKIKVTTKQFYVEADGRTSMEVGKDNRNFSSTEA